LFEKLGEGCERGLIKPAVEHNAGHQPVHDWEEEEEEGEGEEEEEEEEEELAVAGGVLQTSPHSQS